MKNFWSVSRSLKAAAAIFILAGAALWLRSEKDDGDWVRVVRRDLALGIDVTGTLRAVNSSWLGPPQLSESWDYKISYLAGEGEDVKKGQAVLRFDTSDLQSRLDEKIAERDSANEKIEQREADNTLRRRQEELQLAEAEATFRKASLKADVPDDLVAGAELQRSRLDRDVAGLEVEHLKKQSRASQASDDAALAALRKEHLYADSKVKEITRDIERMTVTSPRDGTVVYVTNWRGEKKKVGDSCWGLEKPIEIPDLSRMMADGEVDEVDGGVVAAGQQVAIRLDAYPDDEFTGSVKSIGKTVQMQKGPLPLKIFRVQLDLDKTDPVRMRPGMRFRGKIQIVLSPHTLVIPSEAVFLIQQKPIVYRHSLFGIKNVAISPGKRTEESIEVLEGLREGDRIARRELGAQKESGL